MASVIVTSRTDDIGFWDFLGDPRLYDPSDDHSCAFDEEFVEFRSGFITKYPYNVYTIKGVVFRFTNVQIPNASYINSVHVVVKSGRIQYDIPAKKIGFSAVLIGGYGGVLPSYTPTYETIDKTDYLKTVVNGWSPHEWISFDVSEAIQRVVVRDDWVAGNEIILVAKDFTYENITGAGTYENGPWGTNWNSRLEFFANPLNTLDSPYLYVDYDDAKTVAINYDSVTKNDEATVTTEYKSLFLPGKINFTNSKQRTKYDGFKSTIYTSPNQRWPIAFTSPSIEHLSSDGDIIYMLFREAGFSYGKTIVDSVLSMVLYNDFIGSFNVRVAQTYDTLFEIKDSTDYKNDVIASCTSSPLSNTHKITGQSLNITTVGWVIPSVAIELIYPLFTIDFYFKAQYDGILFSYCGPNFLKLFLSLSGTELSLNYGGGSGTFVYVFNLITSEANIAKSVWYRATIVKTNSSVNLYVNGVLKGSVAYSGVIGGFTDISDVDIRQNEGFFINSGLCAYIDNFSLSKNSRFSSNFSVSETIPIDTYTMLFLSFDYLSGSISSYYTTKQETENLLWSEPIEYNTGSLTIDSGDTVEVNIVDLISPLANMSGFDLASNILISIEFNSGALFINTINSDDPPSLSVSYLDEPNPFFYLSDNVEITSSFASTLLEETVVNSEILCILENQYIEISNAINMSEIIDADWISNSIEILNVIDVNDTVDVIWNVSKDVLLEEDISMSDTVDVDWISNSIFVNITATAGLYK